jgi:PleD family two-component response regulator
MSDDKNKDPKANPLSPAPGAAAQPAKKPAGSDAAKAPDAPKAAKPAAPAKSAGAKPAAPKPSKEALRETDLYPAEDEDAEEEDDEDAGEALFGDEGAGDEEVALDPTLGATDTSERIILVVDEDGQRRNETVAIISQILPNAVIEVANDPEEALGMMEEGDFDTFVVNFLMPGYSSSPFVKAVANHPEHPLLIGFAADKMSDAVDPKKGLKIIPLKRLFDLDTSTASETPEGEPAEE